MKPTAASYDLEMLLWVAENRLSPRAEGDALSRRLVGVHRVKILGHFGPEIGVMPRALRWA